MNTDSSRKKSVDLIFDVISRSDPTFKGYREWYYHLISKLDQWYKSEGNQGVKRMKNILNTLTQLAFKEETEPLSYVKSDKDNGFIPNILEPILPYLKRPSRRSLSIILTVSRLTDLYDGSPDDQSVESMIQTIQGPKAQLLDDVLEGKGKYDGRGFKDFLKQFLDHHRDLPFVEEIRLGIRKLEGLTEGVLWSTKSGPNSNTSLKKQLGLTTVQNGEEVPVPGPVPAFLGVYHDLHAITKDGISEHVRKLGELLINETSSDAFKVDTILVEAPDLYDQFSGAFPNETISGKISAIGEKSGKIRHVAVGDLFSQVTLKPLHEKLFKVLKQIPNDCTFNQTKMVGVFQEWTSSNRFTASFDQSSCTDLFPIELQLETVSHLISESNRSSFKEELEQVLVGRDFTVTYPSSGKKRKVRYTRGQPMGLYGSWAMMALTHHMLVMYSHYLASGNKISKRMFDKYAILGDDIVISDKSTSSQYLTLCRDLGMKINKLKSHITGHGTGISSNIEFAKINIWKGKVLQPIRPHLVIQSFRDNGSFGAISLLQTIKANEALSVSKKHCKSLIERYYIKHRRILELLLEIPTPLGGIGYQGRAVKDIVSINTKDGHLNPVYLYLARKLMSVVNETESKEETLGYLAIFENHLVSGGYLPEKFRRSYSRVYKEALKLPYFSAPIKLKTDEALNNIFSKDYMSESSFNLNSLDIPKKINLCTHHFDDMLDLKKSSMIWEKVLEKIDQYRVILVRNIDHVGQSKFYVLKKNQQTETLFKENVLWEDGEELPIQIPGEEIILSTTLYDCLPVRDYVLSKLDSSVRFVKLSPQ